MPYLGGDQHANPTDIHIISDTIYFDTPYATASTATAMFVSNTGNVGIGTTGPTYKLDVSGTALFRPYTIANSPDVVIGNILVRSYNKSLTTGVNDYTYICTLTTTYGALTFNLNIVHNESASSESKMYFVASQYNATNNVWYRLNPLYSSGAYSGNDWAVDINIYNNVYTLRLVRIGGTSSSANFICTLNVFQSSNNTVTIGDTTTTGAGATNSGLFNGTLITQYGGYVGIGTTSPSYPLHLYSTNSSAIYYINQGTTTNSNYLELNTGASNGRLLIGMDNASGTGLFGLNTAYAAGIGTPIATPLYFATNNTIRMTMLSGGNVGIGITTPQSLTHLHSTAATTDVRLQLTDATTTATSNALGVVLAKNTSSEGILWNYSNAALRFATNNTERLTILNSGYIGHGITTPQSLMHLHSTSATTDVRLMLTDATTGAASTTVGMVLAKNTSEEGLLWNYYNAALRFATNNTERLTILAGGNIGNGITTPQSLMHLHSTAATTDVRLQLTDATTTATSNALGVVLAKNTSSEGILWNYSNAALRFATNNTERLTILAGGNIGIGTNNPSVPLAVTTATSTGGIKLTNNSGNAGDQWWLGFGHNNVSTDANDRARIGCNIVAGGSGRLFFTTGNAGSQVTTMWINEDGKIGHGITTPQSLMHLHSTAATTDVRLMLTDATTGAGSTTVGLVLAKNTSEEGILWNYYNAALRFATNNTERLTILAGGNIGIGTNNPATQLHLYSGGAFTISTTDGASGALLLNFKNTSGYGIYANTTSITSRGNTLDFYSYDYSGPTTRPILTMRPEGNVGIGTTSPTSKLSVNTSVQINNSFDFSGAPLTVTNTTATTSALLNDSLPVLHLCREGTSGQCYGARASFHLSRFLNNGTDSKSRLDLVMANASFDSATIMTVYSDGKIGHGITTPQSLMHLHSTAATTDVRLMLTDATTGAGSTTVGLVLAKNTSEEGLLWNYYNAALRFATNNVERLTILAGGNIGNGITTPQSLMHLHSTSATTDVRLQLTDATTTATSNVLGVVLAKNTSSEGILWNYSNAALRFATNNVERLTILNSGYIGNGITTPQSLMHLHSTAATTDVRLMLTDATTGAGSTTVGLVLAKNTSEEGLLWNYYNAALRFATNNTERITILNDGKVGINTSTPLHNMALVINNPTLCMCGTTESDTASILFGTPYNTYSASTAFKVGIIAQGIPSFSRAKLHFCLNDTQDNSSTYTASVTYARMTIIPSGNVGIGTTNPTSKLSINTSVQNNNSFDFSGAPLTVTNTTATTSALLNDSLPVLHLCREGTAGQCYGARASFHLSRYLNDGTNSRSRLDLVMANGSFDSATIMTINSNGNIGHGITTPQSLMHLHSTAATTDVRLMLTDATTGAGSTTVGLVLAKNTSEEGLLWNYYNAALRFATNNTERLTILAGGNVGIGSASPGSTLTVNGSLAKTSGTFDIPHPLYTSQNSDETKQQESVSTKRLVHSFIEGPRVDLIYRGSVRLVNGRAEINLDKDCVVEADCAMTEGTFVALCKNPQYFLQNNTSFARVRGSISGNILTIFCEDSNSTDEIYWQVIAERGDPCIRKWERTNSNGYLVTEYDTVVDGAV